MKKLLYLCTSALLANGVAANAQTTFPTAEVIDINNIRTTALLHGDLWFDPANGMKPLCEFPKGSDKQIMSRGAIWMAGYDKGNTLHVSAQTYRQSGNDYWPGPLDAAGNTTVNTVNEWAKIWKINREDITQFLAIPNRNSGNIPKAIMEWPAKGNTFAKGNGGVKLTVNTSMAPFVDVDKDGKYDPVKGDYPDMHGDQMLWWVLNDNGPTHNHSINGGIPLQMEVHCRAFAFKRNTSLDNIIFYEFDIINKSPNEYKDFRAGLFADVDLGDYLDDYIGFDSSHRMGIVYNGKSTDGSGQPYAYGQSVPVAGVTLLRIPGDEATAKQPAGSFTYYNGTGIAGNPERDNHFDNYMRSKVLSGDPIRNDYMGPGMISHGFGVGPLANYVFPGDPAIKAQWSECASVNAPGDRRFVISTNDFTFASGSTQRFAFALVVTDMSTTDGCFGTGFSEIKKTADTAWSVYKEVKLVSVEKMPHAVKQLKLYPNPANDELYLETNAVSHTGESIHLYDNTGKNVTVQMQSKAGKTRLDISSLPPGIYQIQYINDEAQYRGRFIKQ